MLAIELRHNTYFLQCNISPGFRPNPHTPLYSSTNNGPLSSHPWRFMDYMTYLQEGSYSITQRRYVRLPSDIYNLTWHFIFSLWLTGQHDPTSCTRGMSQFGIIVGERTSTPVCTCCSQALQHLSLAVWNLCKNHTASNRHCGALALRLQSAHVYVDPLSHSVRADFSPHCGRHYSTMTRWGRPGVAWWVGRFTCFQWKTFCWHFLNQKLFAEILTECRWGERWSNGELGCIVYYVNIREYATVYRNTL